MKPRLITVKNLVRARPEFSEGQIRWQLFNADTNGLTDAGVILKINGRLYLDEDRYDAWIDGHRVQPQRLAA